MKVFAGRSLQVSSLTFQVSSFTFEVSRSLLALALYLVLAIALTWPLGAKLDTTVVDRGDPFLNAFILDWNAHALTHDPLHLFNAPIFYPAKLSLAFSEHMTGIALLILPFHLGGFSAIAQHNIAILLSFALSGFGMFVLGRQVTRDAVAAFAAGVFFAFVSFKFSHLSHVQVIASGWIALTLAALLRFQQTRTTKHALLFAAAFTMNGLTNVYWLLFTGFAVAVTAVFLDFDWKRLALAIGVCAVLLVPFLVPYEMVSREYSMLRNSYEAAQTSATWSDWVHRWPNGRPERYLFPGIIPLATAAYSARRRLAGRTAGVLAGARKPLLAVALVCALAGCVLVHWHKSDIAFALAVALTIAAIPIRVQTPALWAAWIWIAIGFIGSFGENSFLQPVLFRLVEPFRATRSPARWAIIAYCGLGILMAIGTAALPKLRYAIVALAIIEVIPRITWQHVPAQFPPVYHWLARNRPAAAIELPVGWNETEAAYVLASSVHRVPIMNGVSGFDTDLHRTLSQATYDDRFFDLVEGSGVTTVVVHPAAHVTSTRLQELVRFADGDVVCTIRAK